MNHYHTLTIFLILLGLYILSWLLVRFKIQKLLTHRKIWNLLLLISFLVVASLGLILAFSLDYKNIFSWYQTGLWLHVEFGIALSIISLMHILWHWRYYLTIIRRKNVN